jgi:hypothetical protein
MGGRRVARGGRGSIAAFLAFIAFIAVVMAGGAFAQPKDPKDPGGDIEADPAGGSAADSASGSGGTTAGAPDEAASPAASVKDPKIAKKWLVAGQQLMQKASYLAARNRPEEAKAQLENAIIAYQKAISAGSDINVYAELAIVEDKLGKLDQAVKHLRMVIHTKTGVRPDVARKATARLEELSAKVGLVTLTVLPAGSSITLGGAELGTSPLPEPLVLMPGTYMLSFQADGFEPKEAEIKIEPGSETERAIELEPVKVIVKPVAPASVAEAPQGDGPRRSPALPLYLGAGVTGAGVLGAGIFGILAVSQHTTFTAAATSPLDRADARTSGQRFALIADLSLATAVAAAGFTAYWYFTRYRQPPRKQEERRPLAMAPDLRPIVRDSASPIGPTLRDSASLRETKLDVVPWVQPQSGGVMIAGWF